MLWTIIAIIISYLVGSVPTAYIFGRALKGIDIRQHGSGNVGATNVMRVLGKRAGVTVLVLDIVKGLLPVLFVGDFLAHRGGIASDEITRILIGIACICGHNWTVFLRFKGGKGVATTLGVLIGLAVRIPGLHAVLGATVLTWLLIFVMSKIISLGSVCAAVALPFFMWAFGQSPVVLVTGILLSAFVLLRHKSNIIRLIKGTEPRLSLAKHA